LEGTVSTITNARAQAIAKRSETAKAARWRLIAWCLLMALLVSLAANAGLIWIIVEATTPY